MEFKKHHRSIDAIKDKATKGLGIHRNIFYTEEEIQFVKENYPSKGAEFCAKHLGISKACCSDLATKRLKLTREDVRYTEEEINFIKEHYLTDGAKYCADHLGTTADCIISLANKRLGLKDKTVNAKKKVYCKELDITFESGNAAERYMLKLLSIKRYHLTEGLKSGKPIKGYHWEYVE